MGRPVAAEQTALFEPRGAAVSSDDWDLDMPLAFSNTRERRLRDMGLRYFQREAVTGCFERWEQSPETRALLIEMATGLGKTQVFCSLAALWDGSLGVSDRVLVLAHRDFLVEQGAERMRQLTGEHVEIERAEYRATGRSRIVVASVDTIKQPKRMKRFAEGHFGLIIADECFPAGTLVDGRPIESLNCGDVVRSVDHVTGEWKERHISHVSSRTYHGRIIKLRSGDTVLRCTANHPIWVKGKGYVAAESVSRGDVLCVWSGLRKHGGVREPSSHNVLPGVPEQEALRNDGGYESRLCFESHDRTEPNAEGGHSPEGLSHAPGDRPSSFEARRERYRALPGGESPSPPVGSWVGVECGDTYPETARLRVPDVLQAGPVKPPSDGVHRSGRLEPQFAAEEGAGPKEGGSVAWARVDSVETDERSGAGGIVVYNLEVEETGTYFAEGILVHNCHHFLAKTYKRPLDYFADAKLLGVTATPRRGDKKALGQIFDDVAFVMRIWDGIESGYLVPVRGIQVDLEGLDLDHVKLTKGELVAGDLDEKMLEHVEFVVQKSLELEPDRPSVAFFPGVKTAELAAERFNAAVPGSAGFICGSTPDDQRAAIIRDFRAGRIRVLCNCMIATEGFDVPTCSCIIQARPTLSETFVSQTIGRGTRVLPGLVDSPELDGPENAERRRDLIASSAKSDCVVLDFVGAGKISSRLKGVVDVLGGEYSEAEVEKAKAAAKANPGRDTRDYLRQARSELQALAKSLEDQKASVRARVSRFDPFDALGVDCEEDRYRSYAAPARPWQVEMLARKGVGDSDLRGLTRRKANALIKELDTRSRSGLCTLKQLKQLSARGIPDRDIPFEVAGAAMSYISSHGWGKSKDFNPSELRRIVDEGKIKHHAK